MASRLFASLFIEELDPCGPDFTISPPFLGISNAKSWSVLDLHHKYMVLTKRSQGYLASILFDTPCL